MSLFLFFFLISSIFFICVIFLPMGVCSLSGIPSGLPHVEYVVHDQNRLPMPRAAPGTGFVPV